MSNLIDLLSVFFSFIFEQLRNVANFFTSSTLGVIILSIVLIYVIVDVVMIFLNKGK